MHRATPFTPPAGRLGALLVPLLAIGLLLGLPGPASSQTAVSVTAWGSSAGNQLFDGVSIGLAHRSPGTVLQYGVSSMPGYGSTKHAAGYSTATTGYAPAHAPVQATHYGASHYGVSHYGASHYGPSCWDVYWDWWNYGWNHPCDPTWWSWGWAPIYVVTPVVPVRHRPRVRHHRPALVWGVSIHVGWWGGSYWAYDPWAGYAYSPGWVYRPHRWHTTYVYAPDLWVVHPPPHRVVHRPGSPLPARGYVAPATGYKENPGAPATGRAAVPRGATATASAPAPAPDLRTNPGRSVTGRTAGDAASAPLTRTAVTRDDAATRTGAATPPTTRQTTPTTTRQATPPARTDDRGTTTEPPARGPRPTDRLIPGAAAGVTPPTTRQSTPPPTRQATPPSTRQDDPPPTVIRGTPPTTRSAPPTRTAPPTETRQAPPPPTRQAPPPPAQQAPPPTHTRQAPPPPTRQTPPPAQTRQAPPPAQTQQTPPPTQTRQAPPPPTRSAPPPTQTRQAPPPPTRQAPPPRTGRGGG